jgi:hypothetical protein
MQTSKHEFQKGKNTVIIRVLHPVTFRVDKSKSLTPAPEAGERLDE